MAQTSQMTHSGASVQHSVEVMSSCAGSVTSQVWTDFTLKSQEFNQFKKNKNKNKTKTKNKTKKQNKTKQNKTKQNKTNQNKKTTKTTTWLES